MRMLWFAILLGVVLGTLGELSRSQAAESLDVLPAYQKLVALFPEDRQGWGIDTMLNATEEQPMTYGLVLSAEAIHLRKAPNDESQRRVKKAVAWLLANRDLDGNGQPGWGLPQPWDAWADGTTNPPHQPYTITTAICLNGLLDALAVPSLWSQQERDEIHDVMRKILLRWCHGIWSEGYGGGYFWYSPSPNDKVFGINAPAMFLGSMARILREQPEALSDTERQLVQERTDALAEAIVRTVTPRDGAPFWRYAPLPNRFQNDRPNDLLHQVYILWGAETYRDCGGRVKLPWTRAEAIASVDRFWRDGQMWEFPQDSPGKEASLVHQPPRLWCVGMALAFYAKWGPSERAGEALMVIDQQYGPWPELRFLPQSPKGEGKTIFYPRQAAHVLYGLAYLAFP